MNAIENMVLDLHTRRVHQEVHESFAVVVAELRPEAPAARQRSPEETRRLAQMQEAMNAGYNMGCAKANYPYGQMSAIAGGGIFGDSVITAAANMLGL